MRVQPNEIFDTSNLSRDRRLCFVLMPFTLAHSEELFLRIKNLCKTCGINAARADEITSPGVVVKSIWDSVVKARFIVADLTQSSPNVFYELGLAHALGKYVILLTQESSVPFDVAGMRFLRYEWTPAGVRMMEIKLKKILKEAVQRTDCETYYPQSDEEADFGWETRIRELTAAHHRELDRMRQQQIDHLTRLQATEAKLSRMQIESARLDRTFAPRDVLHAMYELEYSADPDVRLRAIATIVDKKSKLPLPNIFQMLEKEFNPRVRIAAIQCIGSIGEPHHFADILTMYQQSDDETFKDACLLAMFRFAPTRLIQDVGFEMSSNEHLAQVLLRQMYLDDDDWAGRRELLEPLLDSKPLAVRWLALKVLTKHLDAPWSPYSADLGEIQIARPDLSLGLLVSQSIESYKRLTTTGASDACQRQRK